MAIRSTENMAYFGSTLGDRLICVSPVTGDIH